MKTRWKWEKEHWIKERPEIEKVAKITRKKTEEENGEEKRWMSRRNVGKTR
jgi:Ethanolamine utilization protein EutJ (predicted chaperonin)